MSEKELADVLAESREYIEEHGLYRGEFRHPEDGRVCAIGGVLYSQGIPEHECSQHPTVKAVSIALIKALNLRSDGHSCMPGVCGCLVNRVTQWNDSNYTTQQQVLDGFMLAEKNARSGSVN